MKLEKCLPFMTDVIIEGALKTGFKLMWASAVIETAEMPVESEVSARAYAWKSKEKDSEMTRVIFVTKDTVNDQFAFLALNLGSESACIEAIEKFKKEHEK